MPIAVVVSIVVILLSGWISLFGVQTAIDRYALVSRYNPSRIADLSELVSNYTTPMQVGNGNFAFGADITGLQTLLPFAIMSSWGWKNDSLPPNRTWEDVQNYRGTSWLNHGRLVRYDFGSNDSMIEQWLTANPNRVNLGRIGLVLLEEGEDRREVVDGDVTKAKQQLDLWTGKLWSQFLLDGTSVSVETVCAQEDDMIGITISSPLLEQGRLGIFLDFPWNDGSKKFSAPFVGVFNSTNNHTTSLETGKGLRLGARAQITHSMDTETFLTTVGGDAFTIRRDSPRTHRYTIRPIVSSATSNGRFALSVGYSTTGIVHKEVPAVENVIHSSVETWQEYWSRAGFLDLITGSTDPRADELQRRVVLSRYLMRVNEAGDTPPQESGLVNDGWYGKFHMEMYFWHSAHWALWCNWDLLRRSSSVYADFLTTSLARAQIQQGWASGARWPKMTDPSGRSSPGEINNLLIWEQPHPLVFAEYERRAAAGKNDRNAERRVLEKWKDVIRATADWMAVFAWWNPSTEVYDLGPPMFVVSEDTSPNVTMNPAFELAYWRFGLSIAREWMERLGEEVPAAWTAVRDGLAALPIQDGLYAVYEGIDEGWWGMPEYTSDHPALVGLYGWLPQTPGLDLEVVNKTVEKVWNDWNISNCWGWDFPMLAMSAARLGEPEKAIEWLLHPLFQFDDVGMPVGGVRAPTPYFPGSGALLYAVAMMAGGWDGSVAGKVAPGFPDGWDVQVEGRTICLFCKYLQITKITASTCRDKVCPTHYHSPSQRYFESEATYLIFITALVCSSPWLHRSYGITRSRTSPGHPTEYQQRSDMRPTVHFREIRTPWYIFHLHSGKDGSEVPIQMTGMFEREVSIMFPEADPELEQLRDDYVADRWQTLSECSGIVVPFRTSFETFEFLYNQTGVSDAARNNRPSDVITAKAFSLSSFESLSSLTTLFYLNFAAGTSSDLYIALVLCYFLNKSRTGGFNSRTDSIITVLMMYTINTGLLTAFVPSSRRRNTRLDLGQLPVDWPDFLSFAFRADGNVSAITVSCHAEQHDFYRILPSAEQILNNRENLREKDSEGVSIHLSRMAHPTGNVSSGQDNARSGSGKQHLEPLEIVVQTSIDRRAERGETSPYTSDKPPITFDRST
ncbi:hypothetical protein EW146_g2969 [Bondarzewia mesenterica]|uniref:DUF6534 domain-containing protein n=1 Tax=Bondarzewia mesenterica TaxID=1095465 RepID=A0A4S4LZ42_9AGAM|nr:hypothetical protein EW146_g2969 [Bondarzewia mesenterica]